MMENVIDLSAGKDEISFSEIPRLIAEAITPAELADTEKITAILKRHIPADMPYDEEMIPLENLTDNDWGLLNLACELSDLPPLKQGNKLIDICQSEWMAYEKAIKEYKPEWQLVTYNSTTLNIIANKHLTYLKDAILKNKVLVYDHLTHIPLQPPIDSFALEKAYMTISDFKKYAENFNLTVLVGNLTVVENTLPTKASQTNVIKKSILRSRENEILTWLTTHEYEPKKLPNYDNGFATVKSICRGDLIKNTDLFPTAEFFDKSWERLRRNFRIQNVKP